MRRTVRCSRERTGRRRPARAAALLTLAAAGLILGSCASAEAGREYVPTFAEWTDLTFNSYAARLSHPGVYRIIWDGRGAGRFILVSSLDPGMRPFGEATIDSILLGQVRLLADTARRLCIEWTERGFAKDHTEIRFVVRFPPKRDIDVPIWDLEGEVRAPEAL